MDNYESLRIEFAITKYILIERECNVFTIYDVIKHISNAYECEMITINTNVAYRSICVAVILSKFVDAGFIKIESDAYIDLINDDNGMTSYSFDGCKIVELQTHNKMLASKIFELGKF